MRAKGKKPAPSSRGSSSSSPSSSSPPSSSIEARVDRLAEVLRRHELNEIEIEEGGVRIYVRRGGGAELAFAAPVSHAVGPASHAPAPSSSGTPAAAPSPSSPGGSVDTSDGNVAYVTSPFVGTFYRAPSPDAPPFVEVGTRVKKGQVLCIVEAMKLMNEIEAEVAGTVVRDPRRERRSPSSTASRCSEISKSADAACSRRSSSPTAARSRCASSAPAASWASQSVAVHSTADADALHVRFADESVCIGPPPRASSYLNIPAIISAAEITGADAIHPGYGFLVRERRVRRGLPSKLRADASSARRRRSMRLMGDKVSRARGDGEGRRAAPARAPACSRPTTQAARGGRARSGFPVILKASAGGGGRGMKIVARRERLLGAASRRRAPRRRPAFGNPDIYLERYVEAPRHIEVQVLADGKHGRARTSASASARSSAATRS